MHDFLINVIAFKNFIYFIVQEAYRNNCIGIGKENSLLCMFDGTHKVSFLSSCPLELRHCVWVEGWTKATSKIKQEVCKGAQGQVCTIKCLK